MAESKAGRAGNAARTTGQGVSGAARKTAGVAKGAGHEVAGAAKEAGQGILAALPTQRLAQEAQNLVHAAGERLLSTAEEKIEGLTGRLADYTQGEGGKSLLGALTGNDKSGGVMGEVLKGGLKGGVKGVFQKVTGGKGSKAGFEKVTNIVESIDIGAPRRLVYDQWTQFQDFPTFMKKVETVRQESDEKLVWKAQVFWSHRTWDASIVEQIPDHRIIWRSEGQKGYVDGVVTFHELSDDLTRVLVALEYHPQGLFERTGNVWRAQGRRVRLELKHFRRHVMSHLLLQPDDVGEGWRGEIRDGEVVKDHETAMEEERAAQEEAAREEAPGEEADELDQTDELDQAVEGEQAEAGERPEVEADELEEEPEERDRDEEPQERPRRAHSGRIRRTPSRRVPIRRRSG